MDRVAILRGLVSANMEIVEEFSDLIDDLEEILLEAIALESIIPICSGEANNKLESAQCLFLNAIYMNLIEVIKSFRIGNLNAACMLLRSVFENYMLLTAITKHPKLKLAELWQLNSYYEKIKHLKKEEDKEKLYNDLRTVVDDMGIDYDSIKWEQFRNSYGWLYPLIPKKGDRNIHTLCKILNTTNDYDSDFRYLSEFVHGNSLYQKAGRFTFYTSFFSICSIFLIYVDYIVEDYCISTEYYDDCYEELHNRILELLNM